VAIQAPSGMNLTASSKVIPFAMHNPICFSSSLPGLLDFRIVFWFSGSSLVQDQAVRMLPGKFCRLLLLG
jgi:hypothetical protein